MKKYILVERKIEYEKQRDNLERLLKLIPKFEIKKNVKK